MRGINMDSEKLPQILDLHAKWLREELGGTRADLSGADLSGADLSGADLSDANLTGADLSGADLRGADLSGANLSRADLSGANLRDANLSGANLSRANLSDANLSDADLSRADLRCAKLPNFQLVPEKGEFTAWKKVEGDVVLDLLIPATAKRTSSLIGRKCRVSRALVVAAYKDGKKIRAKKFCGKYTGEFVYEVGKVVKPDSYDDDVRVECTHGIHCFITRREAEEY